MKYGHGVENNSCRDNLPRAVGEREKARFRF